MADRTLIVSAGHLLARGYLTVPTDRLSPAGQPVNGLFGVARSIRRALDLKSPQWAVAVVAPLAEGPPALQAQLDRLVSLLETHNFTVAQVDDEASIVASYTRAAVDRGHDVVILGSDKRYAQLVAERVWWYDAYKDARYTPDMVVKRFLVKPEWVADWLAMVGDDDALSGIKGIGKKERDHPPRKVRHRRARHRRSRCAGHANAKRARCRPRRGYSRTRQSSTRLESTSSPTLGGPLFYHPRATRAEYALQRTWILRAALHRVRAAVPAGDLPGRRRRAGGDRFPSQQNDLGVCDYRRPLAGPRRPGGARREHQRRRAVLFRPGRPRTRRS